MIYNLIFNDKPIHVLEIISNHNYYALHLHNNEIKASNFPFFLFVEYDDNKYFVPALTKVINSISYAFTNYICYVGQVSNLPQNVGATLDISFNPFMELTQPEVVNQAKQLLGVD